MAIVVTPKGTGVSKTAVSWVAATFAEGDSIIVCLAADGAGGALAYKADQTTLVATLTADALGNNAGNVVLRILSYHNLTALQATDIAYIRLDDPGLGSHAGAVYGVSGLASSPFDKSASNTGSGTAGNSGATATLSQADEVAFGGVGVEDEIDDQTGSWTTGAGNVSGNEQATGTNGGGDASNISIYAAAEVVAATTAQTAEVTGMDSIDWAAVVATYKGAVEADVSDPAAFIGAHRMRSRNVLLRR